MADARERGRRPAGGGGRIPPHNLDAEASLLGALLLSRDAIDASGEVGLAANDFYKPAHQHVYEAVRVLAVTGEPVDAVTVAEELRRAGLLDEIGGAPLLLSLQAATPAISNASRYARIVQDTALLRRMIGVASEIAELAYDDPDDVAKALDEAESKVFGLAEQRVTDSTKALGDLLHGAMNDLEAAYERGHTITGTPTGYTDLDDLLNGLQPSTLNVVGARPSMGKCVAWDTEVVDPATGAVVTAAELHRRGTAGEWVQVPSLDDHGHLLVATPSAFVDDGVRPLLEVRTRLGRRIRTTTSHPFLTEHGWRRLVDLREGVRIGTPCRLPWFGSQRLPGAELVLLAFVLGDGGLRRSEAQRRDEAVRRGRSMDVDALEALHRHGLWHAEDEHLAMPPAIYRLPRAQLLHFLGRLLEVNRVARTANPGRVAFVGRSEPLVRAVQHLLLRFGVLAALRPRACRRAEAPGFELVVEDVSAVTADADALALVGAPVRAMVAAGPASAADVGHASVHADVYWDEVVAIEPAGVEQVYDLTVPDLHNFVAADVVVHNTSFALGMATHVAVESHLPVLFVSLEMGHRELTQRILSSEARVDSKKLQTGKLTEQDWSKIAKAIGRLEAPLYIDDNPNITVMEIRAKARRMAARHGKLGLIVVDYLQLMTGRASAENRQVEVSEISRGLKILARELETPVIALSQLSRNLESRSDKRPMLSDLRESGCLTAGTTVACCDGSTPTLGELLASGARDVAVWTLDEHFRLIPGRMTHVFPSGAKPVFELRLASGRRVQASANHPFCTVEGWRRLDQLRPGTHIASRRNGHLPARADDVVPREVWQHILAKSLPAHGKSLGELATALGMSYCDRAVTRSPLSRSRLARVAQAVPDPFLEDLAASDVLWDEVVELVPLGVQEVFDATVPVTHSFVADGVVVHNSIEQDADVVMFIYRDEVHNPDSQDRGVAEIIVAKHRNGPIGTKRLVFLGPYTRFDNAARGV
jgi:replicative DNA helicase